MLSSLKKVGILFGVLLVLKVLSQVPYELAGMLAIILIFGILGILAHMRFRNNENFKL